jgi:hypothetical protein
VIDTLSGVLDAAGDYEAQVALASQDLERLVRRLRGLSALAWRTRREPVEALLEQLERTTASIEDRPPKPIPILPDHALADAVSVLGHDVVSALVREVDGASVRELVSVVRAGLGSTQ